MKFIEFFIESKQAGGVGTTKFINPVYVESVTPANHDKKTFVVMNSGDDFVISMPVGDVVNKLEGVKS